MHVVRFLAIILLSTCLIRTSDYPHPVSRIFNQPHHSIIAPKTVKELHTLVTKNNGPICVVGTGKSQGGQTDCKGDNVCRISLRNLNKLLVLDMRNKEVTVQAGMTWQELQESIAPHRLSIKTMQSYNDFSIGGSLGVNVHGQDPHTNPLIASVVSCKILLADGRIVKADRKQHKELFCGAIGGYGLLGIIIEVTLSLTDDVLLDRLTTVIDTKDLSSFFNTSIKNNPHVHFYSARLSMGASDLLEKALIITYEESDKDYPELFVLNPTLKSSVSKKFLIATKKFQAFKNWRLFIESLYHQRPECISRNNFMNTSIESLPQDTATNEYILQEYFIPYEHLNIFVAHLKDTIQRYEINMLNVTARHVNQDTESLLSFAPHGERCALVLYVPAAKNPRSHAIITAWTQSLIDKALELDGTYYLPYHLIASPNQFQLAYGNASTFFGLKRKYDPFARFNNMLYQRYTFFNKQ